MEKEFIPYEQALELKELGFNEPCFGWFRSTLIPSNFTEFFLETEFGMNESPSDWVNSNFLDKACSAPLYQQAFKFFREKYGLMHIINPYDFTAEINYLNKRVVNDVYGDFIPHDHLVDDEGEEIKHLSYEDAENACLLELINICKKK